MQRIYCVRTGQTYTIKNNNLRDMAKNNSNLRKADGAKKD